MTWNLAGSSPVPYKVNQSGGVTKRRVLVEHGTNPLECKLPGGANAGAIVGVARETVADGDHVAVQQYGEVECVASAAIALNANVNVADAQGRVKAVSEAGGTAIQKVGTALTAATAVGDIITVRLELSRYTA